MNNRTLTRIVVLGALTGMRSMAGISTLAWTHRGVARTLTGLAAAGELIADKTSIVGGRIAPLPLAGRAILGAAVGAVIAREQDHRALVGGTLGAASAVAAAYVAYHVRRRLPFSTIAGGLLEDGLVLVVASGYVAYSRHS